MALQKLVVLAQIALSVIGRGQLAPITESVPQKSASSISGELTFVSRGVSKEQVEAAATAVLSGIFDVDDTRLSVLATEAPGVQVNYQPVLCSDVDFAGLNHNCSGVRSGESCSVSCPSGYRGRQSSYVCHMDGTFHGRGPECSPLTCSLEALTGFDSSACVDVAVGQWCLVGCLPGFTASPSPYTCMETGMFAGSPPSCSRMRCKLPSQAGLDASDCEARSPGEHCKLVCSVGYTGQSRSVVCGADGTFEGDLPSCEPLSCSIPPWLSSSIVLHTCGSSLRHDQTCTARCAHGFTGIPRHFRCIAPSLLGEPMSCEPDVCTENMPTGDGLDVSDCLGKTAGQSCSVSCLPDYQQAAAMITCGPGAAFSNASLACVRVRCPDLSLVAPFEAGHLAHTCSGRFSGESCSVQCGQGYKLMGAPTSLICRSGQWTELTGGGQLQPPMCIPRRCADVSLGNPGLAHDCFNKTVGENCMVFAADGYVYEPGSSASVWTCSALGAYVGKPPKVAHPACGAPSFGPGVASTCVNKTVGQHCWAYCMPPYTTQSMGEYRCSLTGGSASYKAVSHEVSCICTGLSCVRRFKSMAVAPRKVTGACDHSAETVGLTANGLVHDCLGKAEHEVCLATCGDGYVTLGSPAVVECVGGTFLARALPSCLPRPCTRGLPAGVAHNCTDTGTGSFCMATCAAGYSAVAGTRTQEVFTCNWTGELVGEAPQCQPAPCSPLALPISHRGAGCIGAATGQSCVVDCAEGWTLQGDASLFTCLGTGAFSGRLPSCKPKGCFQGLPAGAQFKKLGCEDLSTGGTCVVGCADGYHGASSTFTCSPSGKAVGEQPSCLPLLCPDLDEDGFIDHDCRGIGFGQWCNVSCAIGYEAVSGQSTHWRECALDGHRQTALSGTSPRCQPKPCKTNLSSPEQLHNCSGIVAGGRCASHCAAGYVGTPTVLFCSPSGELEGTQPVCRRSTCGARSLPGVADTCAGAVFGSSCIAYCLPGYTGAAERWTCDIDGRGVKLQGPAPECQPQPCRLEQLHRFVHNCSGVYTGGSCSVSCRHQEGSATLRCLGTGLLEGDLPSCWLDGPASLLLKRKIVAPVNRQLGVQFNDSSRFSLQYTIQLPAEHAREGELAAAAVSNSSAAFQAHLAESFVAAGADEGQLASLFFMEKISTGTRRLNAGTTTMTTAADCATWCAASFQCSGSITFWSGPSSRTQIETAALGALASLYSLPASAFSISISPQDGTNSPATPKACTEGFPTGLGIQAQDCLQKVSGETCTVSCGSGYEGQSAQYVCHMDGKLRGSAPTCQQIVCNTGLPSSGFDTSACDQIPLGSQCEVKCEAGYSGTSTIYTCGSDRAFSGTSPDCQRQTCPTHAIPTGPGFDVSPCLGKYVGEACSLTCSTGFTGDATSVTCGSDLSFSGSAPNCQRNRCTVTGLDDPRFNHSCGDAIHEDNCYVWCSDGYTGNTTRQYCNSPNIVGALPTCVERACNIFPSGDGVDPSPCVGKVFNEVCTPSCLTGYEAAVAASAVVCTSQGSFTTSTLQCSLARCSNLSSLSAFQSASISHTCGDLTYSETCAVECADGYTFAQGANPKQFQCAMGSDTANSGGYVNRHGTFTPPACQPRTCTTGIPNEVGMVHDCTGKVYGETCTVSADAGYSGADTTLTCGVDGHLSGSLPTISPSSCGDLSAGGFTGFTTCSSVAVNQMCYAFCDNQAWLITCALVGGTPTYQRTDGQSMDSVTCSRRLWGFVSSLWGAGKRSAGSCDSSASALQRSVAGIHHDCWGKGDGDFCLVSCRDGFTIVGNPAIQECARGALIGDGPPLCIPTQCRLPPVLPRPSITHNCTGLTVDSSCRASCAQGYEPVAGSRDQTFTCTASGELLGRSPQCAPSACRALALPKQYDYSSCSEKVTGQSCVVDCAHGWTLQGELQVFSCSETGEMKGQLPTCLPNPCEAMPEGPGLNMTACQGLTTGGTCSLACADGYVGEPTTLQCTGSGTLQGQRPKCVPRSCHWASASLPGIEHNCERVAVGESCRVTCGNGYGSDESAVASEWGCAWNGTSPVFFGTLPSCDPRPCEDTHRLQSPATQHDCEGATTGSSCLWSCAPGYDGAASILTCTAQGRLAGAAPECVPQVCSIGRELSQLATIDSCHGVKVGESCVVTCAPGYAGAPQLWNCVAGSSGRPRLQGPAPTCLPKKMRPALSVEAKPADQNSELLRSLTQSSASKWTVGYTACASEAQARSMEGTASASSSAQDTLLIDELLAAGVDAVSLANSFALEGSASLTCAAPSCTSTTTVTTTATATTVTATSSTTSVTSTLTATATTSTYTGSTTPGTTLTTTVTTTTGTVTTTATVTTVTLTATSNTITATGTRTGTTTLTHTTISSTFTVTSKTETATTVTATTSTYTGSTTPGTTLTSTTVTSSTLTGTSITATGTLTTTSRSATLTGTTASSTLTSTTRTGSGTTVTSSSIDAAITSTAAGSRVTTSTVATSTVAVTSATSTSSLTGTTVTFAGTSSTHTVTSTSLTSTFSMTSTTSRTNTATTRSVTLTPTTITLTATATSVTATVTTSTATGTLTGTTTSQTETRTKTSTSTVSTVTTTVTTTQTTVTGTITSGTSTTSFTTTTLTSTRTTFTSTGTATTLTSTRTETTLTSTFTTTTLTSTFTTTTLTSTFTTTTLTSTFTTTTLTSTPTTTTVTGTPTTTTRTTSQTITTETSTITGTTATTTATYTTITGTTTLTVTRTTTSSRTTSTTSVSSTTTASTTKTATATATASSTTTSTETISTTTDTGPSKTRTTTTLTVTTVTSTQTTTSVTTTSSTTITSTVTTTSVSTTTTTLDPNVDLTSLQLAKATAACASCLNAGKHFCGQTRLCGEPSCNIGCDTEEFKDYISPAVLSDSNPSFLACANYALSSMNRVHRCTLEPTCACYLAGRPTFTTTTFSSTRTSTTTRTTTTRTTTTTTPKPPLKQTELEIAIARCQGCSDAGQDFCGTTQQCADSGSCLSGGCTPQFCDFVIPDPGGDLCREFVNTRLNIVHLCYPEFMELNCYLTGGPTSVTKTTTTTTTRTRTTSTRTTRTTTPPVFDCNAGYANWRTGWNAEKRAYCCATKQRGCPDTSTTITTVTRTTTFTTVTQTRTSVTLTTTTTTTIKTDLTMTEKLAHIRTCTTCLAQQKDFCGTTKSCSSTVSQGEGSSSCTSGHCDGAFCDYLVHGGDCTAFVLEKLNIIHLCFPLEPTLHCYQSEGGPTSTVTETTVTSTTITITTSITTTTMTIAPLSQPELLPIVSTCYMCLLGSNSFCGLTKACGSNGECTSAYCQADFCDYVPVSDASAAFTLCVDFAFQNMNKIHICGNDPGFDCYFPPTTTQTTSTPLFDCNAGYSNWQEGWNAEKKQYCCQRANRGCE